MDPLTVSASLLSILALVQNSKKLFSAITRLQDPRVDQIYYRLLAEKKRTEGWASHMRVLNSTDLRATIPPEAYDEVRILLGKLDMYYKQAQAKFSAIKRSKEGPIDLPFLKARTKFLNGGYDDLKDFVDALAAMNKALKSIAPPLPAYSPGAYRHRSPIRNASPITVDDVSVAAGSSPMPEETTQDVDEVKSVDEPTTTQSVASIYQATLDTLVVLSVRSRSPQIAQSTSRLRLWGAGLFNMSVPIDTVFESDKDSYRPLRDCILKILVEILVWEGESCSKAYASYSDFLTEQELNILARNEANGERSRDQHSAQATTALLGSGELMGFALESWKILLERQSDTEAHPIGSKTGGDLIPDLIQILFSLLPALRAARQTYCISLAETRAQPEAPLEDQADVQADLTTAVSSAKPSSDSVERKLDAVAKILSKRDNLASKKGKNVKLYSPIFQKERERLREYYAAQRSQSLAKNQDPKRLAFKQTELDQTLSEYIKRSAGKSETQLLEDRNPRRNSTFSWGRSEKPHDKDMKIPIRQEEEERVDEIIDFLRNTTTDLWSISGAR